MSMIWIEVDLAQAQLPTLIERALHGEDVVIVRDARPLVRLTPVAAGPVRRQFGSAAGLIHWTADLDDPLPGFDGRHGQPAGSTPAAEDA